MKSKNISAILCLIVVCAGCGQRATINKLDASSVVLAFGDSLTYGTGAVVGESYPEVLEDLIGCRVINEGVPGETTTKGLRRLPRVLNEIEPGLVILCHGGNDMLKRQSQTKTIANLEAMIVMIKEADVDVVLIGVPKPSLLLKTPEFYKELADKYQIPFDGDTIPEIIAKRSLKSDRIHPNAEGYKKLAQAILDLLKKSQQ